MRCCSKRCFFIWIIIWSRFPAYTTKTSCCISFLQHFLKSKKMNVFFFFSHQPGKLNYELERGGRGGLSSVCADIGVLKVLHFFQRSNKKKKMNKNKLSPSVLVPCNKTCFSVFGLPWALQYESYLSYERQDLNSLSNPRTECSTFVVFFGGRF